MKVDLDVFGGRWVLVCESPAESCLECGCAASGHGLHQVMPDTSNGRPAGTGYFISPCFVHAECPSFKSRLEALA